MHNRPRNTLCLQQLDVSSLYSDVNYVHSERIVRRSEIYVTPKNMLAGRQTHGDRKLKAARRVVRTLH